MIRITALTPVGDAWNAAFGLVLADLTPTCSCASNGGAASGYEKRRPEASIGDREFATGCAATPNDIARQPSKTDVNASPVSPASPSITRSAVVTA